MSPSILFLNQFYPPSVASTGQILSDLAKHLASNGWQVHVLTSNRFYEDPCRSMPSGHSCEDSVHVRRLPIRFWSRGGPLKALGYLEFLIKSIFATLFRPKPDLCVSMTTPPFLMLVAAILRLRGTRHVHWSMDLYPEVTECLGNMKPYVAIPLKLLRRILLASCDRIIVLGKYMGERLTKSGIPSSKLVTVPVWSTGEAIQPQPFPEGPFTLLYSGNMGIAHDFQTAIRAARDLPQIRFVFVGTGPRMQEIEQAALVLSNVSLRPPVPREELSSLLASASAHLVTLDPKADGLLIPSKMFGCMASGRPIVLVASPKNELAEELESSACGVRVPPGDSPGLIQAMLSLSSATDLCQELGSKARAAFLGRYDMPPCVASLQTCLEGIILLGC